MEPHPSDEPLKPVDYDRVQHQAYARGRALPGSAIRRYMAAFAAHLPARRPLTGVDLGSGTGRVTPALAETFGGSIHGVEPAAAMRRTAISEAAHPAVTYLEGRAEAIPLPRVSVDFVLMFLSYHHVGDKPAAAREVARVLKPGGRLILRSTFRERIPDHWWRGYFPRTWDIERAMFPTEAETRALFEVAGLRTVASERLTQPFEGDLHEAVERLKLRAVSTFEHLTEDELAEGFARIEADLAAGAIVRKSATSDFLVFERDT
jgi:ubiquinone/menaquinone biosynthesis C-methylase UbiE